MSISSRTVNLGGLAVEVHTLNTLVVGSGAAGFQADYGFVYLNLRMGRGRSAAVHADAGRRLEAVAKTHFAPLLASRPVGVTLQIDEGPEVFDAKNSSLHPLFSKPN